jgi:hypothetical protein
MQYQRVLAGKRVFINKKLIMLDPIFLPNQRKADRGQESALYPVRNNAPLLCSGVRFYDNSGGV